MVKTYKIKEIFFSLQGEGFYAGRPAVFIRFSGCNLWNGKQKDRSKAVCKFCDTDFMGMDGKNGGKYTANELLEKVKEIWYRQVKQNCTVSKTQLFIIFTGGEPALQVDQVLIQTFKQENCYLAIETNGTILLPDFIDWVCLSPKSKAKIKILYADECKLVYPQIDNTPSDFINFRSKYFYLQPCDDKNKSENLKKTLNYCLANPKWWLSLQLHKYLNID